MFLIYVSSASTSCASPLIPMFQISMPELNKSTLSRSFLGLHHMFKHPEGTSPSVKSNHRSISKGVKALFHRSPSDAADGEGRFHLLCTPPSNDKTACIVTSGLSAMPPKSSPASLIGAGTDEGSSFDYFLCCLVTTYPIRCIEALEQLQSSPMGRVEVRKFVSYRAQSLEYREQRYKAQ